MQRLIIEFGDATAMRPGFSQLITLAESGQIQIRDLEFVHSIRGVASTVAADRVDPALARLDGIASGLLTRAELDGVTEGLSHAMTAAILVFDGTGIDAAVNAWTSAGAQVRTLPDPPPSL